MSDDIEIAEVFEGHKLQQKVSVSGTGDDISLAAIRRAETALNELSPQFDDWIVEETNLLTNARDAVITEGYTGDPAEDLFRAAHDLKGEADTFGYPMVTRICSSLCILLEAVENGAEPHIDLINLHVDAVRALVREKIKGDSNATAESVFTDLATATSHYVDSQKTEDDASADAEVSEAS